MQAVFTHKTTVDFSGNFGGVESNGLGKLRHTSIKANCANAFQACKQVVVSVGHAQIADVEIGVNGGFKVTASFYKEVVVKQECKIVPNNDNYPQVPSVPSL